MSIENSVEFVRPTPEHVLEVLRDWHRHDPIWGILTLKGPRLHMHTSVAEWRDECELVTWRRLGVGMNEAWKIDLSPDEWKQVLEPARTRTLQGVCELIAANASVSKPRSVTILGRKCKPAAAFLAIRRLLVDAGEAPESIAPSTPLSDIARRRFEVFLGGMTKMAPGRLPRMKIHDSIPERISKWTFFCGLLLMAAGRFDYPVLTILGGMLFIGSCIAMTCVARSVPAKGVDFGNLSTLRDLAIVLSGPPIHDPSNSRTVTR